MVYETFEYYLPFKSLIRSRKAVLEGLREHWQEIVTPEVRINIMYSRRRWYFLWLGQAFEWTWNHGFNHPNPFHDANMWMCEFQGVCGRAFKLGKPQSVYFDGQATRSFAETYFFRNQFRLSSWQLRKTEHLKAVISIPILEVSEDSSPTVRSVGVINLDTASEVGREHLQKHEKQLVEVGIRLGKILAALKA